jgi:hypothetical protein
MLDVAIGLILVFLLTGILCTAAMEAIASALALRAKTLEEGLRHLLDDPEGTGLSVELYRHFQIRGLSGAGKPSYIPSTNFARALLDTVLPRPAGEPPPSIDEARRLAQEKPKGRAQDFVLSVLEEAGNDAGKARREIETWFDTGMERVGGLYKRKTQWIVLGVALSICLVANIDALRIANHLNANSVLRSRLVALAEQTVARPAADATKAVSVPAALSDLSALDLNLGWSGEDPGDHPFLWGYRKVLGILVSALAASLGAPFWFDVLSKFINIRSAGLRPSVRPASG